jgi:hypothetical protein
MVKIIQLTNGIVFDSSVIAGSGETFALKMFIPKNYPGINNSSLYNDRIIGTGALGKQFNLNLDGSQQSYPISEVNGSTPTSLSSMFDLFIGML